MKTKTQILVFILTGLILASCKKGPEDPSFTFRTRKNRVVGNWKLASGRSSYEETQANGAISYTEGFTYTKGRYQYTVGSGPSTQIYVGSHSFNMDFSKDGYLVFAEVYDGQALTKKGPWDFNDGIGKAKAKEEINVRIETNESGSGVKTYKGNQTSLTYSILELRNKKMKLRAEYSVKNPDGTGYKYVDLYELEQ